MLEMINWACFFCWEFPNLALFFRVFFQGQGLGREVYAGESVYYYTGLLSVCMYICMALGIQGYFHPVLYMCLIPSHQIGLTKIIPDMIVLGSSMIKSKICLILNLAIMYKKELKIKLLQIFSCIQYFPLVDFFDSPDQNL